MQIAESSIHRSKAQIKKLFNEQGVSIRSWAEHHGFSVSLVYQVLARDRIPKRGESHRIAVALGLRAPEQDALDTLSKKLKGGE